MTWLELMKDYDLILHFHPGKVNVVADALSWKASVACLLTMQKELIRDMEELGVEVCV